jgi:protein O-mannosyl-transferase
MRKNGRVIIAGFIAVCALFLVYSNHFNNPFELDDSHTIVNNQAIRQLSIGEYFSDARTFSSLPLNQAYRPGLTTLNAIDYALWSKSPEIAPQPLWFHVSIFITFVVLCVLLFFFYQKIFELTFPGGKYNSWFSFFSASFFAFHAANAETVNYIIARADIFSTLMVIVAFLMYFYKPAWRKSFWFLIPVLLGFFVKEPTIMFAPLLFLFIYFFEEHAAFKFPELFSKKFRRPFLISLPALVLGIALIIFAKAKTPDTWRSGAEGINPLHYFFTNFFSVVHYLVNFLIPKNLSVDTDWKIVENPFDDKVMVGFAVVVAMIWLAVKCSSKKETRPIAFGILWFFITLIPTSTFFPFAEPNNDHRTFFGYIGLVLAVTTVAAAFVYCKPDPKRKANSPVLPLFFAGLAIVAAHAFGAHHRNKIWGSEELLWEDATKKCPGSGRIWMNLGNAQMKTGDYANALTNFNKARSLTPDYPYVYTNLGVIKNELGMIREGNQDFRKGIELGPVIPDCYFYYGKYLLRQNNVSLADSICDQGLKTSPYNADLLNLKASIEKVRADMNVPGQITVPGMLEKVKINPSVENWLNLSLAFYNAGNFRSCIDANQALKIDPKNEIAYNNICAAHNQLKEWDLAILAGQKGIQINPNNQLILGNLKVALESQAKSK